VFSVTFAPNGKHVALTAQMGGQTRTGTNGEFRIWDSAHWPRILGGSTEYIPFAIAFTPDGSQLVTAGSNNAIDVWTP